MPNFTKRHPGPELLDQPNIPTEDLYQNLRELAFINRWLGGHDAVWKGIKKLWKPGVQVVELGSGGGDNLAALFEKTNGKIVGTGIDLKSDCTAFAQKHTPSDIEFITQDYRDFGPSSQPTLIFTSLFCHHFSSDELVDMFRWLKINASAGFVVADLHRNPVAFGAIWVLTRLFSRSYLVKHDAPLSVLRAFSRKDLTDILSSAGISSYKLQWVWAFRWVLVVPPVSNSIASGSTTSANPSGPI